METSARQASPQPVIRPLAASHLRVALEAAQAGDKPTALGALMSIDNESWDGIEQRLGRLGLTADNILTEGR